ncbi:hypothetical protein OE88DRAFT_1654446 [Heliocybe sulcata]|uniref:Secreted protein n=1 Tax=Heliocybe sulcata TaxID=5364 RepID=A0A5C3NAU9_9AGAM|nr:hypothetical protein OE88DRAFT_1654446 [Heliocybe sulcata]
MAIKASRRAIHLLLLLISGSSRCRPPCGQCDRDPKSTIESVFRKRRARSMALSGHLGFTCPSFLGRDPSSARLYPVGSPKALGTAASLQTEPNL